jgi:hypothetical protein
MRSIAFSIEVFLLFCGLSLSGQSIVPRYRIFPELTHKHTSPVLAQDGNTLFFSIENHLINVGIEKEEDIWVSEKMEDGRWSDPFPISGEVNTAADERPIALLNQSNRLLVCRDLANRAYEIYDFNGNSWIPNEKFQFPESRQPFQWLSFNEFHTVCLFGVGDTSNVDIYVSFIDATSHWSSPLLVKGFERFKNIRDLSFSPDNKTIFFSAENDTGYGGFDIYSAMRNGDQWISWSQPVNIGIQVNSIFDEYEPTFAADGKSIFFTVGDRNGTTAIYQSILPIEFQWDKLLGIKTSAEIFSTNKLLEGAVSYQSAGGNLSTLTIVNQAPLKHGLISYLPKSDYLLLVSETPACFIPSVQLATKAGTNRYAANFQRKKYQEEVEIEAIRLEKELTKQESLISSIQNEIGITLQKIENGKSDIWSMFNTFQDLDLKPIEDNLKILSNTYALTLKLTEEREPNVEVSFSDGAQRVQYWRNEYSNHRERLDEDTISTFQSFLNETIKYQWYTNQLESVREIEKEFEKEAIEKLKSMIAVEDLALFNIWLDEYGMKLNVSIRPSIFQTVPYDERTIGFSVWPVHHQLQLPFFNEISLNVKPFIEREMIHRLKIPMTDLLRQYYYLQFLKDKKQRRLNERKDITLNMETLEVRAQQNKYIAVRDTLLYEPLTITGDTLIHLIAYPFDYPEWIPLQVPFFPIDSIIPDIFGIHELTRILQILSEYPGLGIEMAVQASGYPYREGREIGDKRIGYLNTYFEMAGIGSDRRKVYLLEHAEQRTNNNFPIQVLIRFFYRS